MNQAARMLYRSTVLREPLLREVIRSLRLPASSRGLDVGCGIGVQAGLLAEAVGQAGRVTGLDASASLLELAQNFTGQASLSERVSFLLGDWNELPFESGAFDWVWSADAAGYSSPEPVKVIRELRRVVKPAGSVVVLFWSSQVLLPGYPALEARLNASRAGSAPFVAGRRPEAHFLRALGWLREAGLRECRAETFVGSVFAPLNENQRQALTELLDMRWGAAEPDVSTDDWREYYRLCKPGSPDFILNSPDYCGFFTYSVFTGRVPEA
jgi:ubiquinone/menaquinone biosynthesis C-methylase UbiE